MNAGNGNNDEQKNDNNQLPIIPEFDYNDPERGQINGNNENMHVKVIPVIDLTEASDHDDVDMDGAGVPNENKQNEEEKKDAGMIEFKRKVVQRMKAVDMPQQLIKNAIKLITNNFKLIVQNGGLRIGIIEWITANHANPPCRNICSKKAEIGVLTVAWMLLFLWKKYGSKHYRIIALTEDQNFAAQLHDMAIALAVSVKSQDDQLCSISGLHPAARNKGNFQFHVNLTIALISEWTRWYQQGTARFGPVQMTQRAGISSFNVVLWIGAFDIIKNHPGALQSLLQHWDISNFNGVAWTLSSNKDAYSLQQIHSAGGDVNSFILGPIGAI